MISDQRGSLDFIEGIVATMAVAAVLSAFLGLAAWSASEASEPLDGFDPGMLQGTISEGTYVPGFEEYLSEYADSRGLRGIVVRTFVPGPFCAPPEDVAVGISDSTTETRVFITTVNSDDGRCFVAVHEVSACARATADSSRWRMPCSSSS